MEKLVINKDITFIKGIGKNNKTYIIMNVNLGEGFTVSKFLTPQEIYFVNNEYYGKELP